jgi:hypothetical protein
MDCFNVTLAKICFGNARIAYHLLWRPVSNKLTVVKDNKPRRD